MLDFRKQHAILGGTPSLLGTGLVKIYNPKDLNVLFGYHQKVYLPCRMSIHRIASVSEILPR